MKRKAKIEKKKNLKKVKERILKNIKKSKLKTLTKKKSSLERISENQEQKYPMRLSRHMYIENISSRREADRLIKEGLVLVNNQKAVLGQKVNENDTVALLDEAKKKLSKKIIVLFNKPIGVVSHNPQNGEKEPNDFLPFEEKLSPIGRLDKNSHGLLLMSNDGRLVNKILNPAFFHTKEYMVKVDKHMTKIFLEKMESGVNIEGYITKKAQIKKIAPMTFSLILTEGKKHQIRRMCAALGYEVVDLMRVKFLNIELGELNVGEWRKLNGKEYTNLMKYALKKEK